MSYNSKYTGQQVENLLDQVANGNAGGGSSITEETDPIFSASPAAKITDDNISSWNNKVDKVDGKQLSTEDFTTLLKQKLDGLSNYDDTEISQAVQSLQTQLNTLVSGNASSAVESFNEIIAFLEGIEDSQSLNSIIASIEQQIAGKMDKVTLAAVATSGNYNDLSNKPTIPSAVTESTVSGWGFTKNTGTYSKPSGGIPKTDLASAVQTSLGKADTALQSEQYKGTVTGVKINGATKTPNANGVVDLGTIEGGGGTSSGGSGAYAEVSHGTSDTTFTLTPNTFHVWDEVASLDLSFAEETSGVANEYLFQFTSGATATTLTLPDGLKWANDNVPTIAENMIYQVSVLKGLASVLEFSNAAALIENHGTYTTGTMMSGATLTFEYPVASDLTINLMYADTTVIPKGQSSITIDWIEPAAPTIKNIIPSQDDTYIYII